MTSSVSDGRGACTASVELCVMSAAEAVEQCVALVEQSAIERMRKRPLIATLSAAAASFERGNIDEAFGQLGAFEHKVRAQVARHHPEIADLLLKTVEDVREAILWQMDLRPHL